jgi:hypothetical protein
MTSSKTTKEVDLYLKKLTSQQYDMLDEENLYYLHQIPIFIAKECIHAVFFDGKLIPKHVPSYLQKIILKRMKQHGLPIISRSNYRELKKAREQEAQFLDHIESLQDPVHSPRREVIPETQLDTQLEDQVLTPQEKISQKVTWTEEISDTESLDLNDIDPTVIDSILYIQITITTDSSITNVSGCKKSQARV